MARLYDLVSTIFDRQYLPLMRPSNRPIVDLCHALLGNQGEVSGLSIATEILDVYAKSNDDEKRAFFQFLNDNLDISPDEVVFALDAYKQESTHANYKAFLAASETPRQELIRRLNQGSGATARLVEMRRDLLAFAKEDRHLSKVDLDFKHLFVSWFNRGFLVLRPISWTSPANILEKIISYEAVHAIDSWDDLRSRLLPDDRRCFAYFHPAIPEEPLIFVEVALTKGIPDSIQNLLVTPNSVAAHAADTAVFYSISNCQAGLAGISFGNFLIKHVVHELSAELPDLETFVTLSPIPGFTKWAENNDHAVDDPEALKPMAAEYLLNAKSRGHAPLDPVAKFHLYNGAQIHALHADADTSDKGMNQSAGMMVNYLYDAKKIAQNHEALAKEGTIAASRPIKNLQKAFGRIQTENVA
ncbi:MAG: malonyl-CoA decarboxylase [Paracoccaceae bacterium]|nr:malonyl-CoA decarboxylase [Paracoccaceae bacterium]